MRRRWMWSAAFALFAAGTTALATPAHAAADDEILAFGAAATYGSTSGMALAAPVVGMAATTTGHGYWLVGADGGVFAFGDAGYAGSAGGLALTAPIVGIAADPDGTGYWLVASDGGVFAFDAPFVGSAVGLTPGAPVVALAPTATGRGYWIVASDGGVFAFGDAGFDGSASGSVLGTRVVAAAADPDGNGYWLATADGQVLAYAAAFAGSARELTLASPIVAMAAASTGGYWLVAADGGVFAFGDAEYRGGLGGVDPGYRTITAIAARPDGSGYWLARRGLPPVLDEGDSGASVRIVEEQLNALGYYVGTPDERFDSTTHHAVVALQKVAGLPRTGRLDEATGAALANGVRPAARSEAGSGHRMEVDIEHQVMLSVTDGHVDWIFDVSTGRIPGRTPRGVWHVYKQINGWHHGSLGTMYRPKYVRGGVAVHGYPSVPAWPASHGCIRVTNQSADAIWAWGLMPIGTTVWIY